MKCSHCNKEMPESSVFCPFCGQKVEDITTGKPSLNELPQKTQIAEDVGDASVSLPQKLTIIQKIKNHYSKILLYGGIIFTAAFIGYLIINALDLWSYGYAETNALCIIDVILVILGGISSLILLFANWRKPKFQKIEKFFCISLVTLAVISSSITITNLVDYNNKPDSFQGDSSSSSYEMDFDIYCLLYMKISNVKVTHSGNYAYVTGTIKNTGNYSVKYVKVRASCKNYSGTVIDTAWTYAVDSSWLNPGESKKFEMMIRDTGNEIKTATVTIEY